MNKIQMRKFKKSDWNGYAGAEGDNPKIGEIKVERSDGEIWDCVIISDEMGITIDHLKDDGSLSGEYWFTWKETKGPQEMNDRLVGAFDEVMKEEELIKLGFDPFEIL
jgi:hypothetical protein